MSRTFKDKPYHLGGQRHKYVVVNNHGSHGKWTKEKRQATRADLKRQFERTGELITKSKYQKEYFDQKLGL